MLKTPKYGWSRITIGSWSDRCSNCYYDLPFDLLEGLEKACRERKPVAVQFDAEGWDYIIVFDLYETHIITNKDSVEYTTIEVHRDDLARELIADIRRDIEAWSCWVDCGEMSDDQKIEREEDLKILCEILERRLPSDDFKVKYMPQSILNSKGELFY